MTTIEKTAKNRSLDITRRLICFIQDFQNETMQLNLTEEQNKLIEQRLQAILTTLGDLERNMNLSIQKEIAEEEDIDLDFDQMP